MGETLNPHVDWQGLAVEIPSHGKSWPRSARRRIAGLSSFGFSGTNAHLVLEEAPDAPVSPPPSPAPCDRAVTVLAVSARTPAALETLTDHYAAHIAGHPEQLLDDAITEKVSQSSSVMDYNPIVIAAKGEKQGHFVPPTLGPGDPQRVFVNWY